MSNQSFPNFKNYTIRQELGVGGFGVSYLAESKQDKSLCVIKQLAMDRLKDWKSLELFEREAKTLAQLDHPRIPNFLDYLNREGEDGQEVFLIEQYIPGDSIQDLVEHGKRFTEAQIIDIALEAAEILLYFQTLVPPLIHRDIKPGNIILDESQSVYLIDFGAVRDSLKQQGSSTVIGTFGYMAPEQFQGRAFPETDIYSLGATLLFALTHQEPNAFNSSGLKLQLPDEIASKNLRAVLNKMLEPDLDHRYLNAQTLIEDLLALKAGKVPAIVLQDMLPEIKPDTRQKKRTNAVQILAIGGAVVAILFALFVMTNKRLTPMNADRESYEAIKQRLERTYEETYRAEYGPPPTRPDSVPE